MAHVKCLIMVNNRSIRHGTDHQSPLAVRPAVFEYVLAVNKTTNGIRLCS